MTNRITEIETEIIEVLNVAPLNTYCQNFGVYEGNMELEELRELTGSLPACLISYVGDSFEEVTHGHTYNVNAMISILVVAEKIRDTQHKKGIYTMLKDVKGLLHLSNLNGYLDLPVILKERAPIETAQGVAIYELLFELQFIDK